MKSVIATVEQPDGTRTTLTVQMQPVNTFVVLGAIVGAWAIGGGKAALLAGTATGVYLFSQITSLYDQVAAHLPPGARIISIVDSDGRSIALPVSG